MEEMVPQVPLQVAQSLAVVVAVVALETMEVLPLAAQVVAEQVVKILLAAQMAQLN